MDAENLAKAAFGAMHDWVDDEIVRFEPSCRVRPSALVHVRIGSLAASVDAIRNSQA